MSEETKAKSRAAAITIINEAIDSKEKEFLNFKRNKLRGIQNLVEVGQVWSWKDPHRGYDITITKFLTPEDYYYDSEAAVDGNRLFEYSWVDDNGDGEEPEVIHEDRPMGTAYLTEKFILKA